MLDQTTPGFDWAVSHEPGGTVSVLGGVVDRSNRYQGLLVEAGPGGTRFCRAVGQTGSAALQLTDWSLSSGYYPYPRTVTSGCTDGGGLATQQVRGERSQATPALIANASTTVGRSVPGSIGLMDHFRAAAYFGR